MVSVAVGTPLSDKHCCEDLIRLFNRLFLDSYNTELVRGDDEPIYLPADDANPHHRILFAHGFFSSALHEIAHWLVAGPERRLLEDFGYWYEPDGRSAEQQAAFEQVEVKPQALEWILARASGFHFRVSSDNLSGEASDNSAFKDRVHEQVRGYLQRGLSARTQQLVAELATFYRQPLPQSQHFKRQDLDW